jgi:PAS domain S-box-containing protein
MHYDFSVLRSEKGTDNDLHALQMKQIGLFLRRLAGAPWLLGGIGLVVVTVVGYRLGANVGIASCAYLIVVALLSLMGSFIATLAFSMAAALCLSYFFAPPISNLWIENASDAALLIVFLTAAIIIATVTAAATKWKQSLQTALDEKQQAQARLAAIVSSSDAAIVGKTLDGVVTSWNAGAESTFGYKAHEMIGQSITRIIPAELQKEEEEILRRIRQGDRIKNYQTVRNCKDGRRIDISLTISPVLDQSGNVVGASKIARDITAEKRAEAALQQIQVELARVARVSTVGELTAAIAHELNQPLAGVVNSGNACLRWLSSEPPDISAARKSGERVIAAGERAAEVIKRVRALVEKAPPQREQFNINDAISEVLALIPGEIQRNSISLRTKFANDLPLLFADRIQLQQVILNLVLNAIEAMSGVQAPRDLLVASAKSDSDDGILVTVLDSGTGLDEKSLDRIFEPFFTTKAHGMGIGLAVSRTIIESHGGLLWARPNSPRGAVFAFSVPAAGEQMS